VTGYKTTLYTVRGLIGEIKLGPVPGLAPTINEVRSLFDDPDLTLDDEIWVNFEGFLKEILQLRQDTARLMVIMWGDLGDIETPEEETENAEVNPSTGHINERGTPMPDPFLDALDAADAVAKTAAESKQKEILMTIAAYVRAVEQNKSNDIKEGHLEKLRKLGHRGVFWANKLAGSPRTARSEEGEGSGSRTSRSGSSSSSRRSGSTSTTGKSAMRKRADALFAEGQADGKSGDDLREFVERAINREFSGEDSGAQLDAINDAEGAL